MRIVAEISAHGLGHLTQLAPVLSALRRAVPEATFIVRTAHAESRVRKILADVPFVSAPPAPDPGLVMKGPDVVDVAATRAAYAAVHADFEGLLAREAARLRRLRADFLISDVGHVAVAAAAAAGIPAVALCSLHWAEMVRAYLGPGEDIRRLEAEILSAYRRARVFILAGPRRQVPGLENVRRVAPITRPAGTSMRARLAARAGLAARKAAGLRIGVVSFGGIGGRLPRLTLPDDESWLWILPAALARDCAGAEKAAVLLLEDLADVDFRDLIASADCVVTKTGYGIFTECARHGTPCLFLPRPDWPEAHDLEAWLVEAGVGRPVSRKALAGGFWPDALAHLRPRPVPGMNGAEEAARIILELMEGRQAFQKPEVPGA